MNSSCVPGIDLQNIRMPAEWELHDGTWLSWPKDPNTFPEDIIDSVEDIYVQIIKTLKEAENVNILVNDKAWEGKAIRKLNQKGVTLSNVHFHRINSIDVWIRDYAPIFAKIGDKVLAVKWIYNAYGKYEDLKPDNHAGLEIAQKFEFFGTDVVLEGGSIDTNGKGTFLTTEQCLLNKNRNPDLSKSQIEEHLKNYLGAKKIIWLKEGVAGDDTDGHVDDFARFVNESTVVCSSESNRDDENYEPLKEAQETLKKNGLKVIPLPMPSKIEIPERRLPASYANFYIGNSCVLLPVFNDKNDKKAIEIMQSRFPTRKIVPIVSTDLVYGYGGIHCATQQQPK